MLYTAFEIFVWKPNVDNLKQWNYIKQKTRLTANLLIIYGEGTVICGHASLDDVADASLGDVADASI